MFLLSPKKPLLQLAITGALAFVFFLIVKMPASLLTQQLSKHLSMGFGDVRGTIWHGKADNTYYNNIALGELDWSIPIYHIVTGKISTNLSLAGKDLSFNGRITLGLGSEFLMENARVNIQTPTLLQLLQIPFPVEGKIHADIHQLNMNISRTNAAPEKQSSLHIPYIDALLYWENVGIPAFEISDLGSYRFTVKSEPQKQPNILATEFKESKGKLEIKGKASFTPNGRYKTALTLKPAEGAPEILTNGLALLGNPDAEGRYAVDQEGEIRDILAFF